MYKTIKPMRQALAEARAYRDPVNEDKGFSTQQIKMAYGVLNDPRYKQGNYSGAVSAIEKIAKGLSDHPDVANALRRANEELEEAVGGKSQGYKLVQKAKAIAKKMSGNKKGAIKEIEKLKKGLSGVYEVELALKAANEQKEETITEFKKMIVTIADPMKRAKAMDDIKRFGKGTGFRIDKMSDGKSFRIDGKGADLNKFATDMKNFYGAEIKAESLEEKFTKKDFDKNEDENDHSLNAIMLAKEFGTSKEIKDMEDIDKRHKQRGHINEPDYSKRNALVKKYYSRLK